MILLEVLLPTAAVGASAFFIVRAYLKHEESKLSLELDKARQDIIFPARMQAYERTVLFLERNTPEALIRRLLKPAASARLFQAEMIGSIRGEYDHNMTQQVYMSANAWNQVKTATEETVRVINVSASKLQPNATAPELAQAILTITSQVSKFPTQVAIDNVKKECAQFFLNVTHTKTDL